MDDVTIRYGLVIPATELTVRFVRSRGPGGQHGNKTSTKAVLRWTPSESVVFTAQQLARFITRYGSRLTQTGEMILTSEVSRSQRQNLDDCCDRLRTLVESALRAPKTRRPTRPTKGSKVRRRQAKEQLSRKKQDRAGPPDRD